MLGANGLLAQGPPPQFGPPTTVPLQRPTPGNQRPASDSLPQFRPPVVRTSNLDSITISKDAIEDQIDYSAADSMYFDIKNKQIHLYGSATVKFQNMNMEANYIIIDWKENTMSAEGKKQETGEWLGKPKFKDGEQEFTTAKMKYNYKTNKGIIYDAQTQQEGLNIIGEKGKFFGVGKDTTKHNIIYNRNAIFSTCTLEHPHFGIRSNKQKIVQDKVAIVGPCNLIIGDIPTPLWLPFGFFPMKLGVKTGLIFPQNYQYSPAWGFGLDRVGYYIPINDKVDLQLTTDIYLKGTVRLHAITRYNQRYKYNGQVTADFSYQRTEDAKGGISYQPAGSLQWSHTQDSKANPYRSLGGSINIQTGNYQKNNLTSASARLNSSLNSNMSYRQRFDKPFDLSASFAHSQNTNTRLVNISFPVVNFQTQNLYPFKRKVQTGGERWYERIQMRYSGEAKNQFTATDTTLFKQSTLDSAKFGVRHNVSTSTSFNLLKYFNFTPSVNYKEVWYFKTQDKRFDPTLELEPIDTLFNPEDSSDFQVRYDTTYGKVITDEMWSFKPLRQFNAGASMSTKIFGTVLFKKGKIRGLRHVITPTVGFNYTPDYTNPDWGYFKYVQTDLRDDEQLRYSIYQNNRAVGYDQPPTGGKQMALNYGFGNNFEAKVMKKDSTLKNVKLFNTISVGGSYNFAADSMRWSVVSIGGNTGLFNNLSSFRFQVVMDPYDFDRTTGRRLNDLNIKTNGKLLHLTTWNANISTNITVERLRDFIKGDDTDKKVANQPRREEGTEASLTNLAEPEDFLSLFENFTISHNLTVSQRYYATAGKDSIAITTHTISSRGSIKLTPNWNIIVGNFGYDFSSKRITYPDFSFARDLHCWEMGLSWQPQFGSYSFFIHVKPGKLDFLNIPYKKGIQDSSGFRGF